MALPKKKKKIIADIDAAVKKAAGAENNKSNSKKTKGRKGAGGRPSPRSGNVERFTLLLSEKTAERLTLAFAAEQVKRKKNGEKIDRSLLIEEMIINWLDEKGF